MHDLSEPPRRPPRAPVDFALVAVAAAVETTWIGALAYWAQLYGVQGHQWIGVLVVFVPALLVLAALAGTLAAMRWRERTAAAPVDAHLLTYAMIVHGLWLAFLAFALLRSDKLAWFVPPALLGPQLLVAGALLGARVARRRRN